MHQLWWMWNCFVYWKWNLFGRNYVYGNYFNLHYMQRWNRSQWKPRTFTTHKDDTMHDVTFKYKNWYWSCEDLFAKCWVTLLSSAGAKMPFGSRESRQTGNQIFIKQFQQHSCVPSFLYREFILTLFMLNFSEETKTCINILCHSSTLTCHR